MAIRSIGKIILYNSTTQAEIDALLSGLDTIVFEIEKTYLVGGKPNDFGAVISVDFAGSSPNYIQSLKQIIDASTFMFEENAFVYKVKYDVASKEFDLEDSFIRTEKDTTVPQGTIADGQLINAIFATPGINGLVYTTVELPYNEPISTTDKDALLEVGIELNLSVTGSLFSIKTQRVPFKVSFVKPDSVTGVDYIIDFELQNKIIEI